MHNTSELVIKALAKTLKLQDVSHIQTSDRLRDDLGLDSMSSLTFLMNLEELVDGFYVDPDTLDSDSLATVQTVAAYVDHQIA